MQINLEINDGVIDKLLEKKGYITKDILVHFPLVYSVSGYGSYYMKVSYPMYNKPKCLDINQEAKRAAKVDYFSISAKLFLHKLRIFNGLQRAITPVIR